MEEKEPVVLYAKGIAVLSNGDKALHLSTLTVPDMDSLTDEMAMKFLDVLKEKVLRRHKKNGDTITDCTVEFISGAEFHQEIGPMAGLLDMYARERLGKPVALDEDDDDDDEDEEDF